MAAVAVVVADTAVAAAVGIVVDLQGAVADIVAAAVADTAVVEEEDTVAEEEAAAPAVAAMATPDVVPIASVARSRPPARRIVISTGRASGIPTTTTSTNSQ
jgi:hypothetical protein